MSEADSTYQPKVGLEQDADKLYVREDGYMKFFDQDLSGAQLKYMLWSKTYQTTIANSAGAGSGVLSTINLPSCGVVIISAADACSNASAWFTSTSATVGAEMFIITRGAGVAVSVFISTSGVSIVGLGSTDLSSVILHMSATTVSNAFVHLLCTDTDEWSIVDLRGDVIEQGSS